MKLAVGGVRQTELTVCIANAKVTVTDYLSHCLYRDISILLASDNSFSLIFRITERYRSKSYF